MTEHKCDAELHLFYCLPYKRSTQSYCLCNYTQRRTNKAASVLSFPKRALRCDVPMYTQKSTLLLPPLNLNLPLLAHRSLNSIQRRRTHVTIPFYHRISIQCFERKIRTFSTYNKVSGSFQMSVSFQIKLNPLCTVIYQTFSHKTQ